MSCKQPQLIAHRPRDAFGRSNCLAAIQAVPVEIDIIELDFRQTADGGLVALHDAELAAVSDQHGLISDLTSVAARKIELKPLIPGDATPPAETIPSLDQVIACCGDRIGLYLDCRDVASPPLLSVLQNPTPSHPLLVCSPDEVLKRALAEQLPAARRVKTWRGDQSTLDNLPDYATDVEVFANDLSEELVQRLKNAGYHVGALTLGETDADVHWRRSANLGVDWLMTDNPDAVRQVLEE